MTQLHPFWEQLSPAQIMRDWWQTGLDDAPALPVLAARGTGDGPTLLVTGAVHGDEYEGPAAIQRLFAELDVAQLRGRVIGLPVVNVSAWQARSRHTPADGIDLNRVFPGSGAADGQPTPALAQRIFDTFVQSCDVLIDLHSGGARLMHLPMIGWYPGGERAEYLARRFGPELYPWQLFDRAGVLSREAHFAGKVALGAEWGGGARLDPAGAAAYAAGVRRVLSVLDMLPPVDIEPDERKPILGSYQTTDVGGLFGPEVTLGQRVSQGQRLGQLHDALGCVSGEALAAREGIVAALPHLAYVRPGDRIAYIG